MLAWRTVVNPPAFGNTVVLKPSVESPVSAGLLIPEIMEEAGLDPAADGTVIGPLINATALNRVSGEVQEALDAGARLLTGGSADGPCYRPTVLADVPAGARIHTEETFGPVLVAQPVADADEAVAIANSTGYGLRAGLITGDNQRGFALARRIDSGVVHVNDQTVADEPQLPLGGMKDSGWGRSAAVMSLWRMLFEH